MPALKKHRQERFCLLIIQGVPPYRAYPLAGYRPDNGAPYRLSENARIKSRIAELTRQIAVKTRVTVETIAAQLVEDRDFAIRMKQPGAAHAATVSLAKLHGLMIDRKETGAPGDFSNLTSADEVLALVRAELGDETATLLAKALDRQDGVIIDQPAAATGDHSSGEADKSLALFRTRPKARRN
jgi:hypothetical protein